MYFSSGVIGLFAVAATAVSSASAATAGSYGLGRRSAGYAPAGQLAARYAEPAAYYGDEDEFGYDLYGRSAEPEADEDDLVLYARDLVNALYEDALVRRAFSIPRKPVGSGAGNSGSSSHQIPRKPVGSPAAGDRLTVQHPGPQDAPGSSVSNFQIPRKPVGSGISRGTQTD